MREKTSLYFLSIMFRLLLKAMFSSWKFSTSAWHFQEYMGEELEALSYLVLRCVFVLEGRICSLTQLYPHLSWFGRDLFSFSLFLCPSWIPHALYERALFFFPFPLLQRTGHGDDGEQWMERNGGVWRGSQHAISLLF